MPALHMRYALRTLAKSPGFTVVALLTLALGIGANTAIFSVVNSVLLKPLRAADPGSLVAIWTKRTDGAQATLSYLDVQYLREQNHTLAQLEAYFPSSFNLKSADRPERVRGARVTAGWFKIFGVKPRLGRAFADGEDRPNAPHAIVLREDLWQNDFAADPNLIGKTISLDGESFTVIGIMPSDFRFPSQRTQAWIPLVPSQGELSRGSHFLRGIGRMKTGVGVEETHSDLGLLTKRLAQQYPQDDGNRVDATVKSLREEITGGSRRSLLIILGAVAFVFLIACANVSNLLLVRASARHKEIAIRRAMGATQWQLFRHFVIESMLLAGIGALLGWLLSLWGIDLLLSLRPASIPRLGEIGADFRVLSFTIFISLLAALSFALASALQTSSAQVNESLKQGGRTSAGGSQNRLRSILVAGEIATALILLTGAGLLIESFWRLQRVNPGFQSDRVLTLQLDLPQVKYHLRNPVSGFWEPLLAKLAALPGVQSAGVIDYLPIDTFGINGDFQIEGRPPAPLGQAPSVEQRAIGADYFQALRIPLAAGRFFSHADTATAPPVVIVNQTMARQYWANQNPIGSRIRFWSPAWVTVVGVAGDVRQAGVDSPPAPELYVPLTQNPSRALSMALVIRTSNDPAGLASVVRTELRSVDPEQPVSGIRTMDEVLTEYLAGRQFTMFLLVCFAVVAMLLAALGIYGVMAWTVRQRTREIGIRLALGASIANVFRVVMAQGMRLAGAGLSIGILGALALTRVLSSLLYGVSATDLFTFAAVSLVLAGVASLAIYLPARRATKVDPMVALRYE
jgi:putative ABC transport system permease protein